MVDGSVGGSVRMDQTAGRHVGRWVAWWVDMWDGVRTGQCMDGRTKERTYQRMNGSTRGRIEEQRISRPMEHRTKGRPD